MSSVNWQNYRVENFQTPTFNNTVNNEVMEKTYFKNEEVVATASDETSFDSPSRDFILVDTPQAESDALSSEEVKAEYEDNREEILFLTTTYVEDEISAQVDNEVIYESTNEKIARAEDTKLDEEMTVQAQDDVVMQEPIVEARPPVSTQPRGERTYSEPEFVPMAFTPKTFTSIY